MVFSRILNRADVRVQGELLKAVTPIVTTRSDGLTSETMKTAHELIETTRTMAMSSSRL
jgi:hypothetical protein